MHLGLYKERLGKHAKVYEVRSDKAMKIWAGPLVRLLMKALQERWHEIHFTDDVQRLQALHYRQFSWYIIIYAIPKMICDSLAGLQAAMFQVFLRSSPFHLLLWFSTFRWISFWFAQSINFLAERKPVPDLWISKSRRNMKPIYQSRPCSINEMKSLPLAHPPPVRNISFCKNF